MHKYNPNNERIKRKYFEYLKEAMRHNEASIDVAAKALSRFEEYTNYQNFSRFRQERAVAFKRHLAQQNGQKSGQRLSKATLSSSLSHLKRFFFWLAGQPGYKSRLNYSDAEYFNLSEKDTRIARARRERPIPTMEQINHVLETLPADTEIQRRDRALIALTILTGARDGAIASLKLKHINLSKGYVFQDAREVDTKASKTFTSYFFPVGEWIEQIVVDWVNYLREEKLWGQDDPLFPATCIATGDRHEFGAVGVKRVHWRTAGPIRSIFKTAFEHADLPYFNPHSFRNTLVQLGERLCRSPEQFKAWSQNLGHEKVLTTFSSYGKVPTVRQGDLIRAFGDGSPVEEFSDDVMFKRLLRFLATQDAEALDGDKA